MKIRANLISGQIKQFQKFTGISDATFGRYSMNNSNFVRRARDGQTVTIATAHKCGDYMIRVLESADVPEAVEFRETLRAWLARHPLEAKPAIRKPDIVITHAIPADIAETLLSAEKFILQKFIDAAVTGSPCPMNDTLGEERGGKSRTWAQPYLQQLAKKGLIIFERGKSQHSRRVSILFPPFRGLQSDWSFGGPDNKPVEIKADSVARVQRVWQSEPCFKCGCARGCECGAPALIHTRSGGHLPNLLRSAAR